MPEALIHEALAPGDASSVMAFLASRDEVALVKLQTPVTDVAPAPLYRDDDEVGKTAQIIGKGATGNGGDGEALHGAHRTRLHGAFNVIADGDSRWLSYTFDPPSSDLPLEGIGGSGDSGGPVIIERHGQKQVAGLGSWNRYAKSSVRPFHAGLYGQTVYSIRISRYVTWIDGIISADASRAGSVPSD